MMPDFPQGSNPPVPPELNAAIVSWMGNRGWKVGPARLEKDPDGGFHVWQEEVPTTGGRHALWVSEFMIRNLSAEKLIKVLNSEDMADEIRISVRVRIQERGDEYRVSVVPRKSGEWPRQE
jgi:hypothetical protein